MTMKILSTIALLFGLAFSALAQPVQRTPYTTNTVSQRIPAGIFGTFTANTNVYAPLGIFTNTLNGGVITATTNSSAPIAYIGDGTVTNDLTAGGLTVRTNASIAGALYSGSGRVTNSYQIGGLTVDTNITVNGSGGGLVTLTDAAASKTFKLTAGAAIADNIYWDASTTDTDDTLYGLDGTNVVGVAMIDVDSETQAGGTTMAVTFPTGPQYLRDVLLSLTNNMVFTNTANAAAGRSVTYYIFPNATNYTVNVDTDFKIVGGTFTQGVAVTNRYVLTFKSLSTVDTNVWVSGNYVQ